MLAGPVTATQTTRDAIDCVIEAIATAEQLLGGPLLDDLTDPQTGEITPIFLMTDNGPCFKNHGFARCIDARPELRHIRTRRRSPQTNGVIERYHGAIKIEALWRDLPADATEMTTMVEAFPPALQPHPTTRDARRRPTDRALPRRPQRPTDRHSLNAPKHADSLTRDTAAYGARVTPNSTGDPYFARIATGTRPSACSGRNRPLTESSSGTSLARCYT
ncbi:MAG: hypothetical protein M3376_06760 [Actinomycetota bacterium]|nr:hypothetical protein [Actinomycetota bacterium]